MAYRSDGSTPLAVQKTLLFSDFIILSFSILPKYFQFYKCKKINKSILYINFHRDAFYDIITQLLIKRKYR